MKTRALLLSLLVASQGLLIVLAVWFMRLSLSLSNENEAEFNLLIVLQLVSVACSALLAVSCIINAFTGRSARYEQRVQRNPMFYPLLSRSLLVFKLLLAPWSLFLTTLITLLLGSSLFIAVFALLDNGARVAAGGVLLVLVLYLLYGFLLLLATSAYAIAEFLDQRKEGSIPTGLCAVLIICQLLPFADLISLYIMSWMTQPRPQSELIHTSQYFAPQPEAFAASQYFAPQSELIHTSQERAVNK